MDRITVFLVGKSDINERLVHTLSGVLCYDEPAQLDNVRHFWQNWLSERIEGEKFTIAAAEYDRITGDLEFVGVVRLWKTPYLGNKWLVEGLKVIAPKRKRGIGKALVKEAVELLAAAGVDTISANISRNNLASIALHCSLGFEKSSSGALNSYGEYRQHLDEYKLRILP